MRRDGAQSRLLQLPEELVKHILLLLAMTNDGVKDIARVLLVSKRVKEMTMSANILRPMSFGEAQLPTTESFWGSNGLLIQSARAHNQKAYEEIMKIIKEWIDDAYVSLDFIMPLLEECNARVKGEGILTRSMSKGIATLIPRIGTPVFWPDHAIRSAESMINEFGRQNFQSPDLILLERFDYLKTNADKCSSIYQSLKDFAGVQQQDSE